MQIARMCLVVAVWAPGNERVVGKIQGLGETHMGYLMKSIETVSYKLRRKSLTEDHGHAGA